MQAVLRGYDCRGAGGLQRARRGRGGGGLSFGAVSGGDDGMHLHEKNLQEKMSVWTERRTQQEACVAQARA